MTESSVIKEDDYLVQVKAQVMTRDDSKGGWVPMERGGMSRVGLRRHMLSQHPTGTAASGLVQGLTDELRHEYHIHGTRIADQTEVLNCLLKKDIQYTKATPTFHHWRIEERRFGLTFQSSADARAFDKGVKRAVEDLQEGSCDQPLSDDIGEDEVFMTLNLPLATRKGSCSNSASTASTTTSSPSPQSPAHSSIQDAFSSPLHEPLPQPHPSPPPPPPPPLPPAPHQHSLHHSSHFAHSYNHLHRVHYISRSGGGVPGTLSSVPPPGGTTSPLQSPPGSERSLGRRSISASHESVPYVMSGEVWVKAERNGVSVEKLKGGDASSTTTEENIEMLDYSYVQFSTPHGSLHALHAHDYNYPSSDAVERSSIGVKTPSLPSSRRESVGSMKKHNLDAMSSHPPLPTKDKKKKDRLKEKKVNRHLLSQRSRCVYCHEMFVHDENQRGNCEDAPDKVAECIEKASCICCARGMLYHCMADADGDYGHPCVCDMSDESNCRKWTALSVLALLVPCLWCYWPLTACHRCGVAGGCCGGRHKTA